MVHALLPVKHLGRAKSRLADVLKPAERSALALAMTKDVLDVLIAHPEVDAITLVSDDPALQWLADVNRLRWLAEARLDVHGLNSAITAAVARIQATGCRRIMVLHADLPYLQSEDLSAAITCQDTEGGMVIGADLAGMGTNLLVFDAGYAPRFSFGVDSCRRHQEWALTRAVPVSVIARPGIGADVDSGEDLLRLLRQAPTLRPGAHTSRLLQSWPQGRKALILGALAPIELAPMKD